MISHYGGINLRRGPVRATQRKRRRERGLDLRFRGGDGRIAKRIEGGCAMIDTRRSRNAERFAWLRKPRVKRGEKKRKEGKGGERARLFAVLFKRVSSSLIPARFPARIITFASVIIGTKAWTVITPQGYYRLFATLAIIKNCRYCAESERVSVFLKS